MNITIFSKNISNIKSINNYIVNKLSDISSLTIYSEQTELEKMIQKKFIDFILTNQSDLEYLNINQIYKGVGNIVVYNSFGTSLMDKILFIDFNEPYESIISHTKKIIYKKNNRFIERYLNGLLLSLNFKNTNIGTLFLKDAILYILSLESDFQTDNLHQKIYPYLSKRYEKELDTIEISIIRAIENAIANTPDDMVPPIDITNKRTPKAVINTILTHLAGK